MDVLDRIRKVETTPLHGTEAWVELWEVLQDSRAEIERLRLTDAEREAIRLGELAYPGLRITDKGKWVDVWEVLRGLTARHDPT